MNIAPTSLFRPLSDLPMNANSHVSFSTGKTTETLSDSEIASVTDASELSQAEIEATKAFCLEIIHEVHGSDYNPKIHWDLDSLMPGDHNIKPYHPESNGAFLVF